MAAEFHPLEAGVIVSCGKGHVNFWQLDSTSLTLSRKTGEILLFLSFHNFDTFLLNFFLFLSKAAPREVRVSKTPGIFILQVCSISVTSRSTWRAWPSVSPATFWRATPTGTSSSGDGASTLWPRPWGRCTTDPSSPSASSRTAPSSPGEARTDGSYYSTHPTGKWGRRRSCHSIWAPPGQFHR